MDGSKDKNIESRGKRDQSAVGGPAASTFSKVGETSKKKTKYAQKYHKEWESEPGFKGWLKASSKGQTFAFCDACHVHISVSAGKMEVQRHSATKKHQEMCSKAKLPSVLDMPLVSGKTKIDKSVRDGEIRLAAFICEHDLPIRTVEHMPALIQAICPDSNIAKQIKCGRTKLTSIINHVTGEVSSDILIRKLQDSKFSLIVDESTDLSSVKHLCMVVRTMIEDKVTDCFLGLIPLHDATAKTLYESVISFFASNHIPYKENMIGFGADGANSMLGARNSLSTLLKNDIPGLFVMKCICHSFALCASYACATLPKDVEDLARDVFSYFSCSPKRIGDLKEFQSFVNVKPHKLLHPSQTRWLSLHMVVSRLLEQWDALKLYFAGAVLNDRLIASNTILQRLNNPFTKMYLEFLDFVLPIFNTLNLQMQSQSPQIHKLHKSVLQAFRSLLECYLKDDYLIKTPLSSIEFKDPSNFKDLSSIYLGVKVRMSLHQGHNLPLQDVQIFRQRCQIFLLEAAIQICKRFPFAEATFQHLEVLDPDVVRSRSVDSLAALMSSFPSLVPSQAVQAMDSEWRLLRNSDILCSSSDTSVTEFWVRVQNAKLGDGKPMYPHLASFMLRLLCLPHSSASVERTFSAINRMKTKLRNRLSTKTITGLLHSKRLVSNANCHSFKITEELRKGLNSDMYKKSCIDHKATEEDDASDED